MSPLPLHPSRWGGLFIRLLFGRTYRHSMKGGTLYSNSKSFTPSISSFGKYRTMHYFGRGLGEGGSKYTQVGILDYLVIWVIFWLGRGGLIS